MANEGAQKWLIGIAAALAIVLVLVYAARLFRSEGRALTPEELYEIATTASDNGEREKATAELSDCGAAGVEHLVKLLDKSHPDSVRALAIQGLQANWHFDSMPAFLNALNDSSLIVRGRAKVAVENFTGRRFEFKPNGPKKDREAVVAHIRKEWEQLSDSAGFQAWMKRKANSSQQ